MTRALWVDFNDVDEKGRLSTLLEFAAPEVRIEPGDFVVVGDDEGNRCRAYVIAIEGDVVDVALDGESFLAAGENETADAAVTA